MKDRNRIRALILIFILAMLTACGSGETPVSEKASVGEARSTEKQTEAASWEPSVTTYSVEELSFSRDGQKIYGKLYLPDADGPMPIVILEHGLGANLGHLENYAKRFAKNGIAACAFDFIGGGRGIRSDGKTTEMSVLTEAADLNVVIDELLKRPEIDRENVFLMGGSQGGYVASYVAAKRPEEIRGLIALYPGYVIQDYVLTLTPDPDHIPETMTMLGVTLGRIYSEDARSVDIYEVIRDYPRNVLIIHGTMDFVVPITCSERAEQLFPSARLVKIEGAGHGFHGKDEEDSAEMAIAFVLENLSR